MSAGEGHSASFFFFRPVLPLARSIVPVSSGRIVSSPFRGSVAGRASWRGRYASAGRWRDLASRFSSRPIVSLCGSFGFPVSDCGWRRAPFLSAHSPASFVGGRADRFLFRLVSRFACSSRGASRAILCGSLVNPFHLIGLLASRCFVSPGRSVSRSSVLLVSSFLAVSLRRFILPRPVLSVSPERLVKQSVFFLFAWRLVSAARMAGRVLSVSRPILFCSRIISLVAFNGPGEGRRLVLLLPCGCVFLSLLLSVIVEIVAMAEMGVPFDDTEGRAVLFSSFSPSGKDDEGRYG